MASEKDTLQDKKFALFTTYADGRVAVRYFTEPSVLAAWLSSMATMKALQMVSDFKLFPLNELPSNAVVTSR